MNKSLEENKIEDIEFIKKYYQKKEAQRIKQNTYYREKYANNQEYKNYKKQKNRENYLRRKNNSNSNNVSKQISV
jgi:hypothetical protein